jgi:predicted RNase H-like HicB family nuclease
MMKKALKKIRIVLKEDEEGGFYIYSPDLKGCISQGETEAETVRNFAEAMEGWLEVKADLEARKAKAENDAEAAA